MRARVHVSEEAYRLDAGDREIVPVHRQTGTRIYLHLQPCICVPDIRLTIALSPTPQEDDAIGRVSAVEERSARRQPIGHGQAWYYPADKTIVIWEAFLDAPFRDAPLGQDANMRQLWLGWEDCLMTRFPDTMRPSHPSMIPYSRRGSTRPSLRRSAMRLLRRRRMARRDRNHAPG